MTGSERDLGELLRDGAWLRRFVATLVPEQDVDDVVQSTWLAALQTNTVARSLRQWLCGASANLARLLHRKRSRGARALRHVAAEESHAPAAAHLVEALEVQRLVSDALLALPEPTRTILVLRYEQRLPVATICEQVGLQAASVRQRLHRGREAVRGRLQQRFGDDWRGCIAVGAFLRDHAVPVPVARGLLFPIGSVAAAGLTVALLASPRGADLAPPTPRPDIASGGNRAGAPAPAAAAAASLATGVERIAVAPLAQEPASTSQHAREVRGRVIAAEDKRALAGVRVIPSAGWDSSVPKAERVEMVPVVTGADGTFTLHCPGRVDRLHVWFRAEGRSLRRYDGDPVKPGDLGDIPMRLGFEVKGRLLDDAGAPVARTRLAISVPCGFPDDSEYNLSCVTDERGEFAWEDRVPAGPIEIRVDSAPLELRDGRVEVVAKPQPNQFVLRCRPLPTISGVAFDLDGTPCANLEITAFEGPLDPRRLLGNEVGRCRTKADGSFTLHRAKGESDCVDLRSSVLFTELDLFEPQTGVQWGTSGLRLQARPHADVEVRVIDAEKRTPIERFAVMWTFARGMARVNVGGNKPSAHVEASEHIGRLAHGTRILCWSADPMQAQVEVVVTDTMRGRTVIEVALPRMQSFPCAFVDANGRPLSGTFHVLDRNGTRAPQPWSDPRGGMTRSGTGSDAYRLHTVVTDRDGKGSIVAPTDGRDLVVVRDGPDVRAWTAITLPKPGELLRVVIAD